MATENDKNATANKNGKNYYESLDEFLNKNKPTTDIHEDWVKYYLKKSSYDFKDQFEYVYVRYLEDKVRKILEKNEYSKYEQVKNDLENNIFYEELRNVFKRNSTNISKFLSYKKITDPKIKINCFPENNYATKMAFDCDGCGSGEQRRLCWLSREIYRNLWGWSDIEKVKGQDEQVHKKANNDCNVQRYGNVPCLGFFSMMGPETINTFQTTYNTGKDFSANITGFENLALYTHTIGNFVLTIAGYNQYVCKDYWDLKLKIQYYDKDSTDNKLDLTKYINTFFLWDYVELANDNKSYHPKSLVQNKDKSDSHSKYLKGDSTSCILSNDEVPLFLKNTCYYIQCRGIFMLMLLNIQKLDNDAFIKITTSIYTNNNTFSNCYAACSYILFKVGMINTSSKQQINLLVKSAQQAINDLGKKHNLKLKNN